MMWSRSVATFWCRIRYLQSAIASTNADVDGVYILMLSQSSLFSGLGMDSTEYFHFFNTLDSISSSAICSFAMTCFNVRGG